MLINLLYSSVNSALYIYWVHSFTRKQNGPNLLEKPGQVDMLFLKK